MFRSPRRLEQWIAYDGALGAELLVLEAPDAAADADSTPEIGETAWFEVMPLAGDSGQGNDVIIGIGDANDPFEVNDSPGNITVSLPGNADSGEYFPYFDSGSNLINISPNVEEDNIYIEISDPDGGKFGFLTVGDGEAVTGDSDNQAIKDAFDYFDSLDPNPGGGRISGLGDGDRVMFLVKDGGSYFLREYTVSGNQTSLVKVENGAEVQVSFGDYGVRMHVLSFGNSFPNGKSVLETALRSLTFTADDPGNSPNHIPDFDVAIYYNQAGETSPDGGQYFHDGEGGAFDPGNEGFIADSTNPDFEHVSKDTYESGGGTEPGPPDGNPGGGEGEIITNPDNPGEGGDDDGGDETGDDGGDDGRDNPGESESGGDSGPGGDDVGYVFQDEDSFDSGSDDGAQQDAAEDAAPVIEPRTDGAASPESAAEVRQLELARDMEFVLTAVRNEKEVLLGLIGRLQSEYLMRDPEEFGDLRGYLRRLFDMGRSEENAVNRIIDEMNREMEIFRGAAPGQRDGMLAESVRELIDSAERHSGEMGAYSQAVEAVADLLAARRAEGQPPPSDEEASALFAAEYEKAMAAWQANAERIDPMGRDLVAAQRVGAATTRR